MASGPANAGAAAVRRSDKPAVAESIQALDSAPEPRGHRSAGAGPEFVVTDPSVLALPLKGLYPFKGKGRATLPARVVRAMIDATDEQLDTLWGAMRLLTVRSRVVPGLTLQATSHGHSETTGRRISVRWRRTRDRVWTTLPDGLGELYRDVPLPSVALETLSAADAEADLLNTSAELFRAQRKAFVFLAVKRAQTTQGVNR